MLKVKAGKLRISHDSHHIYYEIPEPINNELKLQFSASLLIFAGISFCFIMLCLLQAYVNQQLSLCMSLS